MNRDQLLKNFLHDNNINNYQLIKIAGDASFRHYYRVILADKSSRIIMDAPPEHEDVRPFCAIGQFLNQHQFSAPKIFATDYQNGFLLLEDFGDDSYRKVLQRSINLETELYQNAVDLLVDLHQLTPPANLPIYNQELLLKEVMLLIDWYLPYVAKKPATEQQITQFKKIWSDLFAKMSQPKILTLRDYHADNLMLIKNHSDAKGVDQVGLLDFQDAVIGVAAYDLVSLLEDARRDVSKATQEKMLHYYLNRSKSDDKQFLLDYQILSLQRNIKIIGIFSRLAFRDKKSHYLDLLPRVFGHVNLRLRDDVFKQISQFLSIYW